MTRLILIPFLLLLFLALSCSSDKPVVIHRYEKALFAINPLDTRGGLSKLGKEYRYFLGNEWQDTMNILRIYNFITDTDIKELYNTEINKYPDVASLGKELGTAFEKIRKYYPEFHNPECYTYISGLDFETPVRYEANNLAISMDLYLGKDVEAYVKAGIPEYMREQFIQENILPSSIYAIAGSLVNRDDQKQTLLDQMIAVGKLLYFLDLVVPDVKDENKIGYTSEKLKWAQENEGNIWAFLVGNQLLFSSDPKITSKLMTDAPFTSGFVNESPGRLGEWVGWQIVKAYMDENASVDVEELMKNTDAQSILQGSKYKPRK
jgi:hypothetical protein